MRRLIRPCSRAVALLAVLPVSGLAQRPTISRPPDDPFMWLEQVDGARAECGHADGRLSRDLPGGVRHERGDGFMPRQDELDPDASCGLDEIQDFAAGQAEHALDAGLDDGVDDVEVVCAELCAELPFRFDGEAPRADDRGLRGIRRVEHPRQTRRVVGGTSAAFFARERVVFAVAQFGQGKRDHRQARSVADHVIAGNASARVRQVARRLAEVDARRLLRAASVFGQVFWRGGVLTLLGQSEVSPDAAWFADLDLPPLVAQTLVRRGIESPEAARAFLQPDSFPSVPFPGIDPAVERINTAIREKEVICVWGDFDVDGQTSTTLLVQTLQALGGNVVYYIPIRGKESHGVHIESLKPIIDSGARLIVTCDTGITAYQAIEYANSRGVDVVTNGARIK